MNVLACWTDTEQGAAALRRGLAEAVRLESDLLIANTDADHAELDPADLGLDLSALTGLGRRVRLLPGSRAVRDAADLVLQAEQEHRVTLIVLGLRHRSRVGKLLLGSHAQRILIDARAPVLAVKAGHDHV